MSTSARHRSRAKGTAQRRTPASRPDVVPAARRAAVARAFVGWFGQAARDLPWRRTRDPYAIWLSEVMCQQTRIDTVIPYYERFLTAYPTVQALAEAPLDDVLQRWSGLGYYRRARQLHRAANEIVSQHGGAFPRTARGLAALSGVGEYTAGAIASIAFGEPAALVDGNVIRVLSRLFALDDDMRLPKGRDRVWSIARQLVPEQRPGDFNQALMELGSQVCTPRSPECTRCPVRRFCAAESAGEATAYPRMSAKKPPRSERLVAAVLQRDDGVLLAQRRDDGLFAGMWEPPLGGDLDLVRTELSRLRALHGRSDSKDELEAKGTVQHVLSHRRLSIEVFAGELEKGLRSRVPGPELGALYQRIEVRRPSDVALSTLAKKVLKVAGAAVAAALLLAPTLAFAAEAAEPAPAVEATVPAKVASVDASSTEDEQGLTRDELARFRGLSREQGLYLRLFGTASGGRGLRLNNPYRLRTQLGDTAQSLSLTAPYADLGLGIGLGDPFGVQHGAMVHVSRALDGVAQSSISASYVILHRASPRWLTYGRAGAVALTAPDPNLGAEVAAGVGAFVTGAMGLTAEVVGNLFYGAGTYEKAYTAVPVISLQVGILVDWEVLP